MCHIGGGGIVAEIKLLHGKVAIVDTEDFDRVNQYKWRAYRYYNTWRVIGDIKKSNGKWTSRFMHRFIMNFPEGLQIDHKNHNGLDNRKCNLRVCTHAENQHNRRPQKGTSIYKGVAWHKEHKKWRTQIRLNNKKIHLGYFVNEITAAFAYDKKAKELYGEFAYPNFGDR